MRKLLLSLFLFLFLSGLWAQEFHFSQFTNAPLFLNPALSGFHKNKYRGIINYKRQAGVSGTSGSFNTFAASFDMPALGYLIEDGFAGIGLSLYNDKAGVANLSTTRVDVSPAIHIEIVDQNYISIGIQASFMQKRFNPTNLTFGNQFNGYTYDPNLSPQENNLLNSKYSAVDFATGIEWHNRLKDHIIYYTGFSLYHINSPKENFLEETNRIKMKAIYNANIEYDLNDVYSIYSTLIYIRQGRYNELNIGLWGKYKVNQELGFSLGAMIRSLDMVTLRAKMHYHHFDLGISYDFGLSGIKNINRTFSSYSPELALSYFYGRNMDINKNMWATPDSKRRHHMNRGKYKKIHHAKF